MKWNGFFLFLQQAKIEAIKQERESSAETMLRTQFKMELLVYSQDKTYSNSLSESKKEDQDSENVPLAPYSERSIVFSLDNYATLQELMVHLKSYYKVLFFEEV